MDKETLIEADELGRQYHKGRMDVWALRSASLRVGTGEFVSITGPSGSGKSTLLHILACLERPTKGTYRFRGQNIAELSDARLALLRNRFISIVFQAYNLLPTLRAWQNVALPLAYAGVPRTERRRRAHAALERVGLAHRLNHYPFEMSGGEEQRVAIARAMIVKPQVLLADEPTGNLDSTAQEEVLKLMLEVKSGGASIVMVTHNNDLANRADRRYSILDGVLRGA